jgi:hypothetical protein
MWLLQDTPALFTDFYELTMAQAYFRQGMDETGYFEVFVRSLPEHWGFFVMAVCRRPKATCGNSASRPKISSTCAPSAGSRRISSNISPGSDRT